MSNGYVRKTTNPKMAWSDERKAESSAKRKQAHAENKWHKKSKEEVALAISNGRKEAIKRKNRSEGQKRRHREANGLGALSGVNEIFAGTGYKVDDQANMKRIQVANQEPLDPLDTAVANAVIDLFDLIEDHLGVRPEYDDFLNNAVEEKLAEFKKALCNK